MKYIRTTKGIWEIEKLTKKDYEWLQMGENKQADTIEELCDEFVIVSILTEQNFITKYPKSYLHKGFNIYGAIWTGKGLIYVAKMNDKGELELL